MELYKVAKVNFKNRPESFKKEFMEFLINAGYVYDIKKNKDKVIIYGMRPDTPENRYPTEEQLTSMVDNYIENYLNPDDLPENEVTKEEFKELVNNIENSSNIKEFWTLTYLFNVNDLIKDLINFDFWSKGNQHDLAEGKPVENGASIYPFTVDHIINKYFVGYTDIIFTTNDGSKSMASYDSETKTITVIAGACNPNKYEDKTFISNYILPKVGEILASYPELKFYHGMFKSMISFFDKLSGDRYWWSDSFKPIKKEDRVTKVEQYKDENPEEQEDE